MRTVGESGRAQFGIGLFEVDQFAEQRVVIGVGKLRIVEDVIAVVRVVELFPQSGYALSGARHRHVWARRPE